MRLLYFLIDGYGGQGGIAQVNRHLLEAFAAHPRVDEVVALPLRIEGDFGVLAQKLDYDCLAASGRWRYLERVAWRVLGERRFDLVVSAHLNLQPLAVLAARLLRAPNFLLVHGFEAWSPPPQWLRRRSAGKADLFLGVSALTLDRFRKWSGAPAAACRVMPCAVDLDRYTPGAPSRAVLEKYRLVGTRPILTLARFAAAERYKGVDEMLEAQAAMLRRAPDLVYVVAGAGDDLSRLQAKAAALGVAESVRFTGFIPESEKIDLYRAARGFVLAGSGEGFGIVLLEAMACGIPVLASTLDGSYEAVQQGRLGAAVDPRDRESLTGAILDLVERPVGTRPGGLEEFALTAFRERAHRLLDEVLAKGGRSDAAR